ncbi:hypothetical protein E4U21_006141 [Claviceps maximensis]|nr:hypothetical protein E4U21_006141 [Claviceps maximensis]
MALSCPDVLEPESDQKPEQGEAQGQGQGEQARAQQQHLANLPFRCVFPCAEYSYETPQPPFIDIQVPRRSSPGAGMELEPSYDNIDPSVLTSEELHIITQSSKQLAYNDSATWQYEERHSAQPVLDFLYLGPTSIIRNRNFLLYNDITMMVVVPYSRTARSLHTVDQASRELGLPVEYVRIDGGDFSSLIQTLPDIIGLINRHLLSVRRDAQSTTSRTVREPHDGVTAETPRSLRGKVLVTCDTGNHHSATIVAAYLMSVYGQSMVSALQFILLKRFSCDFQDAAKVMLQSWEEIVRARSMTAHHRLQAVKGKEEQSSVQDKEDTSPVLPAASNRKRGVDDMASDYSMSDEGKAPAIYEARFLDRSSFVPFVDLFEVEKRDSGL